MADAKDFLFEIGTEEMPSAPLNNAVKQLGTMIAKGLDEAGLAHGEVRVISSPRRLAALVANVATATDEVHEVKRGPAANIAFDADGHRRVGDERAEGCDGILAACQRQSQPQQHTEHDRDAEEDQPARRLGFQITFPPVFIHAPESS